MIKKISWITCVLALAFFLSGCVYYRFYVLKKQLGEFTDYFELAQRDGASVIMIKKPVVRLGDLVWLTGFHPSSVTNEAGQEIRTYYILRKNGTPRIRGRLHLILY